MTGFYLFNLVYLATSYSTNFSTIKVGQFLNKLEEMLKKAAVA
jgi:hypothetical protein